jgi:hypothetical protein
VGVSRAEGAPRQEDFDTALISELVTVASSFQVELTIADQGRATLSEFMGWAKAGAHKVDAGEVFSHLALDMLPESVSAGLLAQSHETQIPVADLLGASEAILPMLNGRTLQRLEALIFADALALLGALGARGSATRAMSWIVDNGLHLHP